jgi:hypothetical protein
MDYSKHLSYCISPLLARSIDKRLAYQAKDTIPSAIQGLPNMMEGEEKEREKTRETTYTL